MTCRKCKKWKMAIATVAVNDRFNSVQWLNEKLRQVSEVTLRRTFMWGRVVVHLAEVLPVGHAIEQVTEQVTGFLKYMEEGVAKILSQKYRLTALSNSLLDNSQP